MTWRRALAYWACFLGLVVYDRAVERRPAGEAVHVVRAPLLNVEANRIDAVELRRDDRIVRCRRVDGRWQVTAPAGGSAPADLIAALVTNITELPDVDVVAENGTDLAQFGLDKPATEMTLTPGGGTPISVRLGNRNPSGTAVYAQRSGSDRVYLIGLNVRYYEDLLFEAVGPQGRGS